MMEALLPTMMVTCPSRRVGVVFEADKRVVMKGFNGVPSKFPHPMECERRKQGCPSGTRLELCVCQHAEQNAVSSAARFGISLKGTTCYTVTVPCHQVCMGALINVGVKRIVYLTGYDCSTLTAEMAAHGNVVIEKLEFDDSRPYFNQLVQIANALGFALKE